MKKIVPHVIRKDIQPGEYRQYILDLGKQYNIAVVRSYLDDFADIATKLSGDEVCETDHICDLLVALKRAQVLSSEDMVSLLVGYLREREGCENG